MLYKIILSDKDKIAKVFNYTKNINLNKDINQKPKNKNNI